MATISSANFLIETKRIAAMVDLLDAACGTGSQTNTVSKGAANAEAAILALGDADQVAALLPGADRLAAATMQANYYGALRDWIFQLDAHVSGINDFCSDNAIYVHHNLRTVESKILPRWVFPPVTELASSSRATGTWTDVEETNTIDTDSYGAALIEFLTTAAIGVADIDVTIVGENYDGETVQTSGTIPASTSDATVVAIAGSVRFTKITAITVTGGTDGDAFKIQTKFDRTPTGCA